MDARLLGGCVKIRAGQGMTVGYLVAACVALTPSGGTAQTEEAGRLASVTALDVGQELRVESSLVGQVEGRYVSVTDLHLTLARDSIRTEIPLASIERLWVKGRATETGALIGAGIGLASGLVFGLLLSSVACEPVDGGDCTTVEVMAVTGALGTVGGAAIGAGIGYVSPAWRLRFP